MLIARSVKGKKDRQCKNVFVFTVDFTIELWHQSSMVKYIVN